MSVHISEQLIHMLVLGTLYFIRLICFVQGMLDLKVNTAVVHGDKFSPFLNDLTKVFVRDRQWLRRVILPLILRCVHLFHVRHINGQVSELGTIRTVILTWLMQDEIFHSFVVVQACKLLALSGSGLTVVSA